MAHAPCAARGQGPCPELSAHVKLQVSLQPPASRCSWHAVHKSVRVFFGVGVSPPPAPTPHWAPPPLPATRPPPPSRTFSRASSRSLLSYALRFCKERRGGWRGHGWGQVHRTTAVVPRHYPRQAEPCCICQHGTSSGLGPPACLPARPVAHTRLVLRPDFTLPAPHRRHHQHLCDVAIHPAADHQRHADHPEAGHGEGGGQVADETHGWAAAALSGVGAVKPGGVRRPPARRPACGARSLRVGGGSSVAVQCVADRQAVLHTRRRTHRGLRQAGLGFSLLNLQGGQRPQGGAIGFSGGGGPKPQASACASLLAPTSPPSAPAQRLVHPALVCTRPLLPLHD